MLKKNKGGRPRLTEWPKDKTIALGEELLKWLRNPENDCIFHLSQFYNERKGIPRSQWRTLRKRVEFIPYYEMALEMVGCKILRNKDLPTAYGSRFLSVYFQDLRDHEREVKREEIEAAMKAKQDAEVSRSIPPNDIINEERRAYDERIGSLLAEVQQLKASLTTSPMTS